MVTEQMALLPVLTKNNLKDKIILISVKSSIALLNLKIYSHIYFESREPHRVRLSFFTGIVIQNKTKNVRSHCRHYIHAAKYESHRLLTRQIFSSPQILPASPLF